MNVNLVIEIATLALAIADRQTGRPRGFAFVTFSSDTEAAEAIRRFHDRELDGRKLVVNEADARPPRRPDAFAAPRGPSAPPPPDFFSDRDRPSSGRPFKAKGSRRGLRRRTPGGWRSL